MNTNEYDDLVTRNNTVQTYGRHFYDFIDGRVTSNDHHFSDRLFEYFNLWWALLIREFGIHESRIMREHWRHLISAETARLIQWRYK